MKILIRTWPLPGQPHTYLPGAGLAGKPGLGPGPARGQRPWATPMGRPEILLDSVRTPLVEAAVVVPAAASGPGADARATALRPRAAILSPLAACSQ